MTIPNVKLCKDPTCLSIVNCFGSTSVADRTTAYLYSFSYAPPLTESSKVRQRRKGKNTPLYTYIPIYTDA